VSPGPFGSACIASPHQLASAAGLRVLESGGNAMDAAIATNLALGVVTPYLCGYGGDLFAVVWKDGISAYAGAGRAPAAATVDAVRAAARSDSMPVFGPLTVTVPGAVEAWFALLDRFGSKAFGELAAPALRLARDGFEVSEPAAESLARAADRYGWSQEWLAVYTSNPADPSLRQPALARTIETLVADGPAALYRGPIAAAIVRHLRSLGGLMAEEDFAEHQGSWVEPLRTEYRGFDVLELPPPTQGVTVLEALNIVTHASAGGLMADGPDRQHLLVEAMKLALADRDAHVSDPAAMIDVPAMTLASEAWGLERSHQIDPGLAARPQPGRVAMGGTAYMCAADADGMMVSLIQSNYMGFGSGVTVPQWGINLQNRGAFFSLDPEHVNAIGPRKRTLHTLIPSFVLRQGRPWMAFGSMGGDGQAQTHLQLLARMIDDGQGPQEAIDAPRWIVSPSEWSLTMESRFEPSTVEALRRRGHRIALTGPFDSLLGHAHAIQVADGGYVAGTDPRAEGAALGF
jgi:gamma-glutamyltranspeptidase / glutathione hydrolase